MIIRIQSIYRSIRSRELGFTLIELLIVIAILGIMAGIAIPLFSQLYDEGETEAYQTELRSIQTAAASMLTESTSNNIVPISDVSDLDTVVTTDTPALVLSDYLGGLENDGTVKTGCTYSFTADGGVTQNIP